MKAFKAGTHQADFKELSVMKADGVVALRLQHLNQKSALEHTTCKLTRAFCTCVRGISCLYQQLSNQQHVLYTRAYKY